MAKDVEFEIIEKVSEAVFAALRQVGCKNVEIECDDADQLVLFADAPSVR